MKLTAEISGIDRVNQKLDAKSITRDFSIDMDKLVEDLYNEIRDSSPVDTGKYKRNWKLNRKGNLEWLITNIGIRYSKFLVWGTRKFKAAGTAYKGYKYADPSRGIIHDLRQILFYWHDKFNKAMKGKGG